MTRERPILFSAPMVRAILEGRKTMTRRVVKVPWKGKETTQPYSPHYTVEDGKLLFANEYGYFEPVPCPYGKPGDRLWVRETWRVGAWDESDGCIAIDYMADGFYRKYVDVPDPVYFDKLWIQSANDAEKALGKRDRYEWGHGESPCRIRPSIFMPRWASRITLEIMSVRVDRLQNIRYQEAIDEGVESVFGNWKNYTDPTVVCRTPIASFRTLWDSINDHDSWYSNPWVWVIEFKKVVA